MKLVPLDDAPVTKCADCGGSLGGKVQGDLPPVRRERAQQTIAMVIDLLDQTRHTFKSKQIQRARELLQGLMK